MEKGTVARQRWSLGIKAAWRAIREALDITQTRMGQICGECRSTISRWESPKYPDYVPTVTAVYALARYYGMPSEELWSWIVARFKAEEAEYADR